MINKETYERAKQILREKGWTKGMMQDSRGRCCAVGAILAAEAVSTSSTSANEWLFGHVEEFKPLSECAREANKENPPPEIGWTNHTIPTITWFNDHNAESIEDIEALYDCAIERMEN